MGAFMSGAVLAMNIWNRKRAGYPPNADDLAGFEQCLATFIHAADTCESILYRRQINIGPLTGGIPLVVHCE